MLEIIAHFVVVIIIAICSVIIVHVIDIISIDIGIDTTNPAQTDNTLQFYLQIY